MRRRRPRIRDYYCIMMLHCCFSATSASAACIVPRIGVVGGGASGIFSAIQAAASGVQVVVLEASPRTLGKVKISGGGRCNVLHDVTRTPTDILQQYPRGMRELRGLYEKHFTPTMAAAWFSDRGVLLKTEADGRMFPSTDSSQTIIDTLLNAADDVDVEIRRKAKVASIEKLEDKFHVSFTNNEETEKFDALILATGSAKIGHKFAQSLGHKIVDPVPSLFTLTAKPDLLEGGILHNLAGVSVPHARVSFGTKKKQQQHQEGPLLITHHGISGPAALRLSAFAAREFHDAAYNADLSIHWAPELGHASLIFDELWKCTTNIPKRSIATSCPLFRKDGTSAIPKRLWAAMVEKSQFRQNISWSEAPKKQVNVLCRLISECSLQMTGKGTFKEEFVTAGGISTKEVDMKTMASRKCPGLYVCGEVLNIDGVTGGFNFMNCWSTGHTAGNGAADFVKKVLS